MQIYQFLKKLAKSSSRALNQNKGNTADHIKPVIVFKNRGEFQSFSQLRKTSNPMGIAIKIISPGLEVIRRRNDFDQKG